MTEPTVSCGPGLGDVDAVPLATLEQAMAWCREMQATVRFYNEPQGQQVRIAVHSDPRDPEHIAVAVLPLDGDDPAALTATIEAARQEIEPQIRRRHLRVMATPTAPENPKPTPRAARMRLVLTKEG